MILRNDVDNRKSRLDKLEAEKKVSDETIKDLKTLTNSQQITINSLKEAIKIIEGNVENKFKKCQDSSLSLER